MPLVSAPALITSAFDAGYALPAINVANLETTQAALRAAEASASPVILQISPGAIAYAGYDAIRELALREASRTTVPVLVHLDHCREPDTVRRALSDGFSSVMFDGSRLEYDENVRLTQEIAAAAQPLGVAVEAELGYIGGKEDTTLSEARAAATTAEEAASFVAATGIDILAPAIGSLHRMPEDSVELDVAAIRHIAVSCGRPLALHGGSGVKRSQLPELIAAGVVKVNISSQVSRALAAGIQQTWQADAAQLDLRRFMAAGRDAVQTLVEHYMQLCASAGRAGTAVSGARWHEVDRLAEPE
jgi:tagatose 1,6-diphosphate aldolase GatY/KbaY